VVVCLPLPIRIDFSKCRGMVVSVDDNLWLGLEF
jgi:hypothetical protein